MKMFRQAREITRKLIARIKLIVMIAIFIGLVVMICIFRDPEFFPIRIVKVGGHFPAHTESIIQSTVAKSASRGFFGTNIRDIQRDLSNLPWVKNASVTRVWPDSLVITVNQDEAIAVWNNTSLMLADGSVYLPRSGSLPNNLPHLSGNHGDNEKILKMYKKMNDFLQPIGLNITHVRLVANSGWEITLSNHIIVLLGKKNEFDRLNRFISVYPETFSGLKRLPYLVDMRYSHGMAVKWKKSE